MSAAPPSKSTQRGSTKPSQLLSVSIDRLSNIIAQKMSAGEDDLLTVSGHQTMEDSAVAGANEDVPTKKVDAVRRTGPKHADATGFHLFNVVVHAATCSSSVWMFRTIFPGECYDTERPSHFQSRRALRPPRACSNVDVPVRILQQTPMFLPRPPLTKCARSLSLPAHSLSLFCCL